MFSKSKKNSAQINDDYQLNHHFILVDAAKELVAPQAILWGEALWWPKNSSMKFTRLTPGDIRVGTRYRQEVLLPFAPSWEVEVTGLITDHEIERTFLNGIFKGKETVSVQECSNVTKVDYRLQYQLRGFINTILWPMVFARMHDQNIKMILKALQEYIMNKEVKGV